MSDFENIPDFDVLPPVPGMPQGCAWGLFDRDGKKDVLGCLNLLTPAVVQRALAEATEGFSVSLNWTVDGLCPPASFRKNLTHNVMSFRDADNPQMRKHAFDDEVAFNTQVSSQWDSLVHYAHQPSGQYYNGARPSPTELSQSSRDVPGGGPDPTLDHWHRRGGLVGRGVLLDYRRYADAHGIAFDCFRDDTISTDDLERVAAWEGVELRPGDILLIRTGFVEQLAAARSTEDQLALFASQKFCGVSGSVDTAKWFWNQHPAAVAADNIAFEQIPPVRADGSRGSRFDDLVLHQYFLSLFGLHIGELWDLKALSEACHERQKYSFLLTSVPLNIHGLVGSPPNALAIF